MNAPHSAHDPVVQVDVPEIGTWLERNLEEWLYEGPDLVVDLPTIRTLLPGRRLEAGTDRLTGGRVVTIDVSDVDAEDEAPSLIRSAARAGELIRVHPGAGREGWRRAWRLARCILRDAERALFLAPATECTSDSVNRYADDHPDATMVAVDPDAGADTHQCPWCGLSWQVPWAA